ncbi:MAG: thioesterase family protein [Pseudomonadota bacterium]
MYARQMLAGWGDTDFNGHMRNTAYLDKSADLRMLYFAEHGFAAAEFARLRIGPVILRDEIEYFREIDMLSPIQVTLAAAGLSIDGSRFKVRNEFFRPDGKLAARVTSLGGWLDLAARQMIAPPAELRSAFGGMPRTEDFSQF